MHLVFSHIQITLQTSFQEVMLCVVLVLPVVCRRASGVGQLYYTVQTLASITLSNIHHKQPNYHDANCGKQLHTETSRVARESALSTLARVYGLWREKTRARKQLFLSSICGTNGKLVP